MDIFYENQWGIIHFCGSRKAAESGVYLKSITGLGLPEAEYQTEAYVKRSGQRVVQKRDLERVITLSADVCSEKQMRNVIQNLSCVMYHPGVLTVLSGQRHRKIPCRLSKMEEPIRQGKQITSVVLQLVCDQPYFTDIDSCEVELYSRKDLICGDFTLPCVFTERIARKNVLNDGDVDAEPVLTIYNTGTDEGTDAYTEDFGIEVFNHTTGKRLKLLCTTEPGEMIVIDIPHRRITSNYKGNVITLLDTDSFLSDFLLLTGCNDIEIINHNVSEEIQVILGFERQYIEAVI